MTPPPLLPGDGFGAEYARKLLVAQVVTGGMGATPPRPPPLRPPPPPHGRQARGLPLGCYPYGLAG